MWTLPIYQGTLGNKAPLRVLKHAFYECEICFNSRSHHLILYAIDLTLPNTHTCLARAADTFFQRLRLGVAFATSFLRRRRTRHPNVYVRTSLGGCTSHHTRMPHFRPFARHLSDTTSSSRIQNIYSRKKSTSLAQPEFSKPCPGSNWKFRAWCRYFEQLLIYFRWNELEPSATPARLLTYQMNVGHIWLL